MTGYGWQCVGVACRLWAGIVDLGCLNELEIDLVTQTKLVDAAIGTNHFTEGKGGVFFYVEIQGPADVAGKHF